MAPKVVPIWRTQIDFPLMGSPAMARVAGRTVAAFGYGGRSASSGGLLVLDAVTGATVWQFDAGSGVEGGATVDATRGTHVYFGDQLGRMHCIDLATRRELWQTALEGAVTATPLLNHGQLFTGTSVGVIAALDPATGSIIRAEKVHSQLVSAEPIHVAQEPRPQSDYLHSLRENIAMAFSLDEMMTLCSDLGVEFEDIAGEGRRGKARELVRYFRRRDRLNDLVGYCERERPTVWWKTTPKPQPSRPSDDSPARQAARITSTPVALSESSGIVLVCALDGGLYRFDPAQPRSGLTRLFDAGAALYVRPIIDRDAGRIVLATYRGDIVAIEVMTGHESWRVQLGKPIRQTPHAANGALYLGTQRRTLHALDMIGGRERWQLDWHNSITTTPLVHDDHVLFGDSEGRIVLLNEATHEVIWEFDAQLDRPGLDGRRAAVFGGFVVHAGHALFGAFNGCAYAVKV